MNRRNKPATKKIEFEPKIPIAVPVNTNIVENKPINNTEDNIASTNNITQSMRGLFAPKSFSTSKTFNSRKNSFILNLPSFFTNDIANTSLVFFDDGSIGIRKNGIIYECDNSFLGDSIVVEINEKVKKIDNADFIVSAYEIEKNI